MVYDSEGITFIVIRPLTSDEAQRMKFIFAHPSNDYTDSELDILISIEKQFNDKKMLSDKQMDLVEEIYARRT
jgi:hypothetical protein